MNIRTTGFTLIEIMVSVGIISVLAAVLYANFGSAREDANNKSLQTAIKETQLALELYKAQFGQYPPVPSVSGLPAGCVSTSGGVSTSNSLNCGSTDYIDRLAPDFIAELPNEQDSGNTVCTFIYTVESANGSWYKLTGANCHAGAVTAADGIDYNSDFARCPTSCASCTTGAIAPSTAAFYESYAVYSAGGECR
jgi:prepilin-type N-terminal cleavage/methylation domain-containing protein